MIFRPPHVGIAIVAQDSCRRQVGRITLHHRNALESACATEGSIMFRSFFLFLSASSRARSMIMSMPFATRVARRFVAGETLDDAIIAIRRLNDKGIVVTLDHLGENVHTEADATRATQAYLDLLDRI